VSNEHQLGSERLVAFAAADGVPTCGPPRADILVAVARTLIHPIRAVALGAHPAEVEVALPYVSEEVLDMRGVRHVRAAAGAIGTWGAQAPVPQTVGRGALLELVTMDLGEMREQGLSVEPDDGVAVQKVAHEDGRLMGELLVAHSRCRGHSRTVWCGYTGRLYGKDVWGECVVKRVVAHPAPLYERCWKSPCAAFPTGIYAAEVLRYSCERIRKKMSSTRPVA
jgi:hypothetical protein